MESPDMTDIALDRPRPVTSGAPARLSNADCQRCERRDLPVLALITSIVDARHASAVAAAGHEHLAALDPSLAATPRKATTPVTRLLPGGFVHVYYEKRDVWDVWQSYDDATVR